MRRSAVTDRADVVLPVAAAVEKDGTYLDWEGRARPFEAVLRTSGALSDARVLHVLADEMDRPIGLPDLASVRAEITALGSAPSGSVASTDTSGTTGGQTAETAADEHAEHTYRLATWHWLLDDGVLQDGEPHLAGTARRPRLHLSAANAAALHADEGDPVTVSTDRGSLTLPLAIADLPDDVVWVPTRTAGAAVRTDLAAQHGDAVSVSVSVPVTVPGAKES